ncbi:MAG: DUF4389 domain-containing protein [Marmoricola sp.]
MTQAPAGWYAHPETGAWWWWDGTQWLAQAPEGAPPPPPAQAPMPVLDEAYPVEFSVDYPERPLSRLKTAFRLILAIPILVVLGLLSGATYRSTTDGHSSATTLTAAGILVVPTVLMLLFRRKYPRWWFDWNLELVRFSTRVSAYLMLMDDRYPSTDEAQSVHLDIPYPHAETDLNRWLPLVKWLLAIPHYIVLAFLYIGAVFTVIFAWFAILVTGRYPRGAFTYVEGVLRWNMRVSAYAFLLTTDKYPPFRLSA